ncbi:hypothetical protein RCG17_23845 [Neobacillus sp. PS3-12]|jgi:hypothetical protein|uniref:hypothetical protein n=1 Tax=Neobacillus sp. PS3-12 TaxID=3070677 RepID=UPI0027DFAB4F|nr:hypothetical protein [Neobacillus sp. PS3-12]WML52378.1 hypothetical protein RCG17_23845 [Neobacillus sp. PS3-12]
MKKQITQKQFINSYRSAGLWFVALFMESFLLRIDELCDPNKKTKLIEELYNNGQAFDKDEGGTRTRVNCLFRIIESGRIVEALETAAVSERLRRDFPDAANKAENLLKRIKSGEFNIPE